MLADGFVFRGTEFWLAIYQELPVCLFALTVSSTVDAENVLAFIVLHAEQAAGAINLLTIMQTNI